jgi:hypothetical protein
LKSIRYGPFKIIDKIGNNAFHLDLPPYMQMYAVVDQGIKFCSKIQSARNHFKTDESVGLVVANPTQLVSSQTDVGSERYCNLFIKSNRQKKKK